MADPGDERFLSRWSRLKRRPETPERPVEPPATPAPAAARDVPAGSQEPEEPQEVPALPEPESLTHDADWTVFLRKDAPVDLQRRALRRLWRMDPVYANLDGLVDYDDDFHDPKFTTGVVKTLFQVGRGMVVPEDEQAEGSPAPPPPAPAVETDAGKTAEEDPSGEEASAEAATAGAAPAPLPLPDAEPDALASGGPEPAPARVGRAATRRWGGFSNDA